jgi:hypothetical protein
LATLRHTCLGFFSFDPEDVKNLGSIWKFIKGTGLKWLEFQLKEHKRPVKGSRASVPKGFEPITYHSLFIYQKTRRQNPGDQSLETGLCDVAVQFMQLRKYLSSWQNV